MPNSKENRETFGNSNNQHSKTGCVRALVSGMYDILNHFYLDIEIAHICVSENELAKRNLKHLKEMNMKQPILVVFERGYPSIEFSDFLEMEGIHYVFRLSSNDYIAERKQRKSSDERVTLKHSSGRLQKIQKRHPKQYEGLKKKKETLVRISKFTLPSGNGIVLVIDLEEEINT